MEKIGVIFFVLLLIFHSNKLFSQDISEIYVVSYFEDNTSDKIDNIELNLENIFYYDLSQINYSNLLLTQAKNSNINFYFDYSYTNNKSFNKKDFDKKFLLTLINKEINIENKNFEMKNNFFIDYKIIKKDIFIDFLVDSYNEVYNQFLYKQSICIYFNSSFLFYKYYFRSNNYSYEIMYNYLFNNNMVNTNNGFLIETNYNDFVSTTFISKNKLYNNIIENSFNFDNNLYFNNKLKYSYRNTNIFFGLDLNINNSNKLSIDSNYKFQFFFNYLTTGLYSFSNNRSFNICYDYFYKNWLSELFFTYEKKIYIQYFIGINSFTSPLLYESFNYNFNEIPDIFTGLSLGYINDKLLFLSKFSFKYNFEISLYYFLFDIDLIKIKINGLSIDFYNSFLFDSHLNNFVINTNYKFSILLGNHLSLNIINTFRLNNFDIYNKISFEICLKIINNKGFYHDK